MSQLCTESSEADALTSNLGRLGEIVVGSEVVFGHAFTVIGDGEGVFLSIDR